MADHNKTGSQGEEEAALYLQSQTYKILAKNYRYGHAEIDIIAKIDNIIIFIEVKTRSGNTIGHPEDFLSKAQQKRIVKAAKYYLESQKIDSEIRFDIISIVKNKELEHIKDAFFLIG
jgi:putative endonuclease